MIVAEIPLNKTGAFLLLIIVGGLFAASALFLMTPKPVPTPKVIMNIREMRFYQGQGLQIQYREKIQKITYLEQTTNCIAIEKEQQTLVFMDTLELIVTDVTFTDTVGDGAGDDMIVVSFVNAGTLHGEFVQVQFNGVTQTGNWKITSGEDKIHPGDSYTVQITVDWTPGNKYSIEFVSTDELHHYCGSFTTTA